MTKKDAIESIKNATKAISMLFTSEDKKFEAVKVEDSSEGVNVEGELVKGTKVSVTSATGSEPAPDGSYELANGVSITVKDGVIDEVKSEGDLKAPKEAKEPDAKAEDLAEKPKEAVAPVEGSPKEEATEAPADEVKEDEAKDGDAVKALIDKVASLEQAIAAIQEALNGKTSKEDMSALGEKFTVIQSAFEILSDTPAEFSKINKTIEAKEDKANKLSALASIWNAK
ncbi:MAG: hypothetical protein V4520_02440 [Bacteroidota bacterium]